MESTTGGVEWAGGGLEELVGTKGKVALLEQEGLGNG